jgi:hypothetical protein
VQRELGIARQDPAEAPPRGVFTTRPSPLTAELRFPTCFAVQTPPATRDGVGFRSRSSEPSSTTPLRTSTEVYDFTHARCRALEGADPDAASVFGLANPARDCRAGWALSRTWAALALAAQGARGGWVIRPARLKSLEK